MSTENIAVGICDSKTYLQYIDESLKLTKMYNSGTLDESQKKECRVRIRLIDTHLRNYENAAILHHRRNAQPVVDKE